jgi:hypothetical protein
MAKFDFIIGKHDFADIQIVPRLTNQLHSFRDRKTGDMVRRFVLRQSHFVDHICQVTLILKTGDDRFTPRLAFSIRNRKTAKIAGVKTTEHDIKASVDLSECHENFWKLVSYLKSVRELEIPDEYFALTPNNVEQIKIALSEQRSETLDALKLILQGPDVDLSLADAIELKHRRKYLEVFERAINDKGKAENWWQDFFETNQWIFGYGLDYRIIRIEQSQANVGGGIFTGRGEKKADSLGSTSGDARFTVLVEIKKPATPLLHGATPQRSGAWSISREFSDAVTQAQAQAFGWNLESKTYPNSSEMARRQLLTFQPKALVVIGRLLEIASDESKASTFELFRQSLHGIDVLTFDQLLERARFIVNRMARSL